MSEINGLAERIHRISTNKGFTPPTLENLPEKLMLSVSELAEALEEHRDGNPLVWMRHETGCPVVPGVFECECAAKPEGILVEIADSIIRNLHMMHSLLEEGKALQNDESAEEWTIEKVLQLKVGFNAGRPAMHGKAY